MKLFNKLLLNICLGSFIFIRATPIGHSACTDTTRLSITKCEEADADWFDSYADLIDTVDAVVCSLSATCTITGTWTFSSSPSLPAASISGNQIAANVIVSSHIAPNRIEGTNIASSVIVSTHITNNALTGSNIGSNVIVSSHIVDGTIAGGDILDGTITSPDISVNTIAGSNIGSDVIISSHVTDGTIQGSDIQNNTITSADIDVGANRITGSNIGSDVIISSHVTDGTITGADIGVNAITGSNIGSSVIVSSHIVDGTITNVDIGRYDYVTSSFTIAPDGLAQSARMFEVRSATFNVLGTGLDIGGTNPASEVASVGLRLRSNRHMMVNSDYGYLMLNVAGTGVGAGIDSDDNADSNRDNSLLFYADGSVILEARKDKNLYGDKGIRFATATLTGLVSCDTIDTNSSGDLACGTDAGADTVQSSFTVVPISISSDTSMQVWMGSLRVRQGGVEASTITIPGGSASAPSIRMAGNTDTGIGFRDNSSTITFHVDGSTVASYMSVRHTYNQMIVTLSKSGNQTISGTSYGTLTWETEGKDTDDLHGTASNTRITAPVNGLYSFVVVTSWSDTTSAASYHINEYLKNGLVLSPTIAALQTRAANDADITMVTAALIQLNANDYVEVRAYNNQSGNSFVLSGGSSLSAVYVGN